MLATLLAGLGVLACLVYSGPAGERRHRLPAAMIPLVASPAAAGIDGLREVRFPAHGSGDPVAGWYAPSRNGAAVIVLHGSGAERTRMLPETRLLAAAGFGVLAFDFPGHGASPGRDNWGVSAREALLGAIDWLVTDRGIDAAGIGGYGFSMGGFTLAQVAADEPRLHAVVLAAPVTDVVWQIRSEYPRWGMLGRWRALLAMRRAGIPSDDEQPLHAVRRIAPRPLLIIAGTEDRVVPVDRLRELFAAARSPKDLWIVPGAGHGDYSQVAAADFATRLTDFFACHLLGHCPP